MKWLFLVSLSAVGVILTVALSGVAAGKHVLSGLDLLWQQPMNLVLFVVLAGEWIFLINDIAATIGLAKILGHKMEFREMTIYAGADTPTGVLSLKSKLYFVYPATIVFVFTLLALQISQL